MANTLSLETPLENKCHHQAERLHKGVVYGGGMVMLDQVERTTQVLAEHTQLTGKEKEEAICAALLHKCFETKRIAEGVAPLTMDEVKQLAGENVACIVQELASEPAEDKNDTKVDQWIKKSEWARGLSVPAQEILMAEKIVNFETSRDKPNMKKPPEWHKEYYETRHLMLAVLSDTNPKMYHVACDVMREGLFKIAHMQQTRQNGGRSL